MESRNHLVTTEDDFEFDVREWANDLGRSLAEQIDKMVLEHLMHDDHVDALRYSGTASNVAVMPEPLTLEKIERIKTMLR
jgi:hypothetical protein